MNISSVIQAYAPYKYAGTFVSIYETLCDIHNKKVEITFNYECLVDYKGIEDYFEVPYYNGVSFNEMSYESIRKNAFNDRNNEIINIINKYGVINDKFITIDGALIGLDFEISINLEKVEEGRKSSNQLVRACGIGEDDYFVTHNATPTYNLPMT